MNDNTTEPPALDNSPSKLPSSRSQNLILKRVGIVAAIFFLIISSLVFLFASVAPNYLGAELQKQLKSHPVIEEQFGELESCTMSYSATLANGNPDVLLFDVVGTKDKGQLIVDQVSSDRPSFNIDSIVIRKYDGREIPLSNAPPKPTGVTVAP